MDSITVKERKATLFLGIIITLVTAVSVFILALTVNGLMGVILSPSILSGIYVILIYYQRYIILETDQLIVSMPFKKKQVIKYAEIGSLLLLSIHMNQIVILLNRQKKRVVKFFKTDVINADIAIEIMEKNKIPCIDLSERLDMWQDIDEYLPALSGFERLLCRPQMNAMKNGRKIEETNTGEKFEKEKKFIKITGWAMLGAEVFALIFLKGRLKFACFVFVLLLVWIIYIRMYPNSFFEVSQFVKNRKYIIKMPFLCVVTAVIFCLNSFRFFGADSGEYFIFTGCCAAVLLFPLALKLYVVKEKTDKLRLISTVMMALLLAFSITFPLNYLFTFQSDGYETIIVKDKDISAGRFTDYYIYADWREDNQQFSVSPDEYKAIREGDCVQICLRRSIFGLHYWNVHK